MLSAWERAKGYWQSGLATQAAPCAAQGEPFVAPAAGARKQAQIADLRNVRGLLRSSTEGNLRASSTASPSGFTIGKSEDSASAASR